MVEQLAARHGTGLAEAREIAERAALVGRPDGIDMDVDAQIEANTFDAHRLVALGLAQGGHALQAAVLERFFSAHFAEGKALDDIETLQRIGGEAGSTGDARPLSSPATTMPSRCWTTRGLLPSWGSPASPASSPTGRSRSPGRTRSR